MLESSGGATLGASLTAAKRVTGRAVVYGTGLRRSRGHQLGTGLWHQVHVIGLNIGVLIQAAPQIFGVVMGEMSALMAAGVLTPGLPIARVNSPTARMDVTCNPSGWSRRPWLPSRCY